MAEQNLKEIWLQPWCADCAKHEDRNWCEDNVWEEGCEECGAKPAHYVLADVGHVQVSGGDNG